MIAALIVVIWLLVLWAGVATLAAVRLYRSREAMRDACLKALERPEVPFLTLERRLGNVYPFRNPQ